MAGDIRSSANEAAPIILLVDPDVLVRTELAEYLRLCGYRVMEAVSATEAKLLLTAGLAEIRLVFTDAQLAGAENGFALASWIRQNRPDVEVVLTAGLANAAQRVGEACEKGPMLTKPFSHEVVLARIQQLLRQAGRPDDAPIL